MRVISLRAAGVAVVAGFAGVVATPAAFAADEALLTPLDPMKSAAAACAGTPEKAVPVTFDSDEAVLVSASGARFFAGDIQMPAPAAEIAGRQNGGDESLRAFLTSRPDVELTAVPAGPENRWGLTPGWVLASSGTGGDAALLQAELLRAGVAIFAPDRAEAACADALRAAETEASQTKAGLWGKSAPRLVYSADAPKSFTSAFGHYVIARGRIVSLGKTRSTRYLNFGNYWKTDFTVTLKASDEDDVNTALGRSGWTLDALEGQVVEIRGSVQDRDGPSVVLRHPEQLVVLNDKRAGRDGQSSN
ncbi:SNase-like nuclease [Stappia aggregata IAM 12614]|uniref:SNase-like nuclease n=1 Tax=Roseibium aggregatum (strain ATCC 25650 / DSM 13394 / JCM 20685 / NBRC 16684 / NCIMB 2208 / IAM 12614 / B1) TaxID=384765 RepID=A0NWS6_ROSAI|nr:hypothetical protein [Roseibium aggregatum]EAV42597.1 SNase-like nuclease [Stappia aggregata IAM 12614] [Roseibium aggregatum IAM 12614]